MLYSSGSFHTIRESISIFEKLQNQQICHIDHASKSVERKQIHRCVLIRTLFFKSKYQFLTGVLGQSEILWTQSHRVGIDNLWVR